MAIHRLVYIANARLPTEKAHGYQICTMCEAFAQKGVRLALMHPHRYQFDPKLRGQNIFAYYGRQRNFEVRTLPNWDVMPLNNVIPDRLFAPISFIHAVLWGLYAVLVARKESADLYYTRDSEIAYWLVRLGLPTVYEAHVVPKRGQRWLLQRIAHRPALRLVVVLTSFIKEGFMAMGFRRDRILVLSDGVDLALFDNLPSKDECRRRLNLPLARPIVGYVGRFRSLEREKGVTHLVEALALLRAVSGAEPILVCVGGPMDAVPAYLNLARHRGIPEDQIRFVDRRPNSEVPYWIRACDVVTIPWAWTEFSAYFTSPLKLFEYMAASVPIVATDLPSIREIVSHGETAWLVSPGDPKALSDGISRLISDSDLRERLARQARLTADAYTWERRAAAILHGVSDIENTETTVH